MTDTTENNILIAEFIEGEIVPKSWTWEYHTSWDSLMPVIEKIESLGYPVTIYQTHTSINSLADMIDDILINPIVKKYSNTQESTKLSTTYKAVIEFINYWNNK